MPSDVTDMRQRVLCAVTQEQLPCYHELLKTNLLLGTLLPRSLYFILVY